VAKECHYVSLKSLGRKEEPLLSEMSRQNKVRRKAATEAMIVLSVFHEVHGGSRLELAFKVALIPSNPKYP